MTTSKVKSRIGFSVMILCAIALIVPVCLMQHYKSAVFNYLPSPNLEAQIHDADGFAKVNWDYWLNVNSDIVGWITIPNTSIDHPIVQARPQDPTFYLSHDIYRDWNPYGAIYLDAGCLEDGLDSKNCVIFGHNMGMSDNAMFAAIAEYANYDFTLEHSHILIQTPNDKRTLRVEATNIVAGWEKTKRTQFENEDDFKGYRLQCIEAAQTKLLSESDETVPLYTLVTCSYTRWSNERTIVYANIE